jgi:hypothetical protein
MSERMYERNYTPPKKSLELAAWVSFGSDATVRMNKGGWRVRRGGSTLCCPAQEP